MSARSGGLKQETILGSTGEFSGTTEKDWKEIASLAEAKEAVRNIQVLSMVIRSYDYGKES